MRTNEGRKPRTRAGSPRRRGDTRTPAAGRVKSVHPGPQAPILERRPITAPGKENAIASAVPPDQPHNPLHGITLERILQQLVEKHGWEEMGRRITIRCFTDNPSIQSSLKFLRKTPWARKKVEKLFLESKG
jgi:hypothetical protein